MFMALAKLKHGISMTTSVMTTFVDFWHGAELFYITSPIRNVGLHYTLKIAAPWCNVDDREACSRDDVICSR